MSPFRWFGYIFNGHITIWNAKTQTGSKLLEACETKNKNLIQIEGTSLLRWIHSCWKKKGMEGTSGIHISDGNWPKDCFLYYSMLSCKINNEKLKNAVLVQYNDHFNTAEILQLPDAILLIRLDLQLDSQQSQRWLYAELSSSSQLSSRLEKVF